MAIVMVAVFGVLRPAVGPAGLGLGRGPFFGAPPSIEATLDPNTVQVATEPDLPTLGGREAIQPGDGLEFLIPHAAVVAIYGPDLRQRLAFGATPFAGGILAIAVLGLLLRIVRTLRDRDPFIEANARRLFVIAGLVGVGGQLTVLVAAWGRLGVLRHPDVASYVVTDVTVTFVPLLVGLGIAVVAEVFRQGTRLRAEVAGLV